MLRRTPLYDRHAALGARFVPFAGFEMPVQYVGVKPEHFAVRRSVGLFDVSHMGEVRVRGPKAAAALDWLVSNHMRDLALGQARYTLMCNEGGGVVDDLVVYRVADDDFLVCVNAANREKDFAWMVDHVRAEHRDGVSLEDEGDAWAQIAVQGRNAAATLAPLTPVALDRVATYHFAPGEVAGVAGCLVARTGYTGEDGFEVFVPAERAGEVWDALMTSGAAYDVQAIGLGARDTLRLEVRYPLYGHELDDDTTPTMARLMWVTKLDKDGGFLGADAIRARDDDSALVGALVDDRKIVREGMAVLHDGEVVGRVTSGTLSPMLDRGVALAYVRRDLAKIGGQLSFDVRGRVATGTIVKGAFYAPDKKGG
ncbi:MAG TPA: glycine cleavage system aminomethyltransferase GcvT [Myxococcota bacterium]|nr:glycine cleavage system aminomethyltransferase GcvT [Myxococcota bacterium]